MTEDFGSLATGAGPCKSKAISRHPGPHEPSSHEAQGSLSATMRNTVEMMQHSRDKAAREHGSLGVDALANITEKGQGSRFGRAR